MQNFNPQNSWIIANVMASASLVCSPPDNMATDGATVHCWASDTGAGIDLTVPSSSTRPLPWKDVTLTVRAGSSFTTCNRQFLFQNGFSTHLHWASFPGWRRRRNVAVWNEIDGKDANSAPLRASCFVEDRLQLTAEPVHRSALREALALLDPEGAPDLADVSAIFTLADSLFDGTLLEQPTRLPGAGHSRMGAGRQTFFSLAYGFWARPSHANPIRALASSHWTDYLCQCRPDG